MLLLIVTAPARSSGLPIMNSPGGMYENSIPVAQLIHLMAFSCQMHQHLYACKGFSSHSPIKPAFFQVRTF